MKQLFRAIKTFFLIPLFLLLAISPTAYAAEFRSGEQVHISATEQELDDLYLFGGNITLDAPVSNELTTAGGDLTINGPIAGSVLVAGGNITLRGSVGNNARIAGGDITIDAPVTNDLVIAGGSVTLTQNASIGGDLIFAGGKLTVDGPVAGKMMIQGGDVRLNNSVGGDVSGNIEELTLGSAAAINGNLSYRSPETAQIAQGATVSGKTDYQPENRSQDNKNNATGFLTGAVLYKLVADIVICLLFVYFFKKSLTTVITRMRASPVKSGALGFAFFFLAPVACLFLFMLLWLGIASVLFYLLTLMISLFIMKIFLGWGVMHLLQRNQKQAYELDWKAAVIGPIIVFLLTLIPVIGWIVIGIILLITLGAMIGEVTTWASTQRLSKSPAKKK